MFLPELSWKTTINRAPITNELFYEYDYGDYWKVRITRPEDIKISDSVFRSVMENHAPVCIHKEGGMLVDDVGGSGGYIEFLDSVFGKKVSSRYSYGENPEADYLWAHTTFGWSKKDIPAEKLL